MVNRAIRATGELMITAGLVVLLFVAYVLWGTGVHTARAQNRADDRLELAWSAGGPLPGDDIADDPVLVSSEPASAGSSAAATAAASSSAPAATPAGVPAQIPLGTGLARLHVPRFGAGYQWVIGEGVSVANLKDGPGHYPGTALPGKVGNFVVSGHRTTYGAPFGGLGELRAGDAIVVETAKSWYTYRMRSRDVVPPTEISVTFPVPGEPDAEPTERLMTMTTCHPQFSAKERMIIYSVLEATLAKAPGVVPPALAAP